LIACSLLFGAQYGALERVASGLPGVDLGEIAEVGARYRSLLVEHESPVFIRPGRGAGYGPDAFAYFADLPRAVLIISDDGWWQFAGKAEAGGFEPPYFGAIRETDFGEAQRRLGPLQEVERLHGYVFFRQTEPRTIAD